MNSMADQFMWGPQAVKISGPLNLSNKKKTQELSHQVVNKQEK